MQTISDADTTRLAYRRDLSPCRVVTIDSSPNVAWTCSGDGSTLFINRLGFQAAGLDIDGASETGWLQIVHPDDAERARIDWLDATQVEGSGRGDYRFRTVDGSYRWMQVRCLPIPAGDGPAGAWVATWSDIDDIKRWQGELADANRRSAHALAALQALQATAPVGMGLVDRHYRVVHINDLLGRLNGIAPADAVGMPVQELMGESWSTVRPLYDQVLTNGEAILNVEVNRLTADGEPSFWLASYYPVRVDEELIGVGLVALDITQRKLDDQFRSVVMEQMAEGLYALDDQGLVTYVNTAATEMLGWSAEELIGRAMHEMVHYQRLDGTPIAASECPLLMVREQGQSIRMSRDAFTRKDGSVFPAAYSSAPLDCGGTVMGAVVVFRDVTEENNERSRVQRELAALTWLGRIQDALDEDRFVLYSQPIVPAHGGQRAEELLLRMTGRNGEIVTPGSFLPVAERYGLIGDIDRWVISRGIDLAAQGRKVEVNISGASVANPEITDLIDRELRRSGADPGNLVFEITETALITDMNAGESFATRIANLGCQLALDDFGTGYGSFTYLKRLPIDLLKIDMEFVRDILDNVANQNVVRAIVNLARAFDLRTVAEGVEDAETWAFLQGEGVDFGQGYHLGRPAPIV